MSSITVSLDAACLLFEVQTAVSAGAAENNSEEEWDSYELTGLLQVGTASG